MMKNQELQAKETDISNIHSPIKPYQSNGFDHQRKIAALEMTTLNELETSFILSSRNTYDGTLTLTFLSKKKTYLLKVIFDGTKNLNEEIENKNIFIAIWKNNSGDKTEYGLSENFEFEYNEIEKFNQKINNIKKRLTLKEIFEHNTRT